MQRDTTLGLTDNLIYTHYSINDDLPMYAATAEGVIIYKSRCGGTLEVALSPNGFRPQSSAV